MNEKYEIMKSSVEILYEKKKRVVGVSAPKTPKDPGKNNVEIPYGFLSLIILSSVFIFLGAAAADIRHFSLNPELYSDAPLFILSFLFLFVLLSILLLIFNSIQKRRSF